MPQKWRRISSGAVYDTMDSKSSSEKSKEDNDLSCDESECPFASILQMIYNHLGNIFSYQYLLKVTLKKVLETEQ